MAVARLARVPNRGEVYLVELDPTRGSEIRKTRPCVIVSPDELNHQLRHGHRRAHDNRRSRLSVPSRVSLRWEDMDASRSTNFARSIANGFGNGSAH